MTTLIPTSSGVKVTRACGSLLDGCLRMAHVLGDAARVDAAVAKGTSVASDGESEVLGSSPFACDRGQ